MSLNQVDNTMLLQALREHQADENQNTVNYKCVHLRDSSREPLAHPWSFASLIQPVLPQQFCRDFWGRQPLHVSGGNAGFYRGLISLAELERYFYLDEFFERHSISTPSRSYGSPEAPPSSVSEVYERFIGNSSIKLRRMERFLDPASPAVSLLRNMETTLQHPCNSLSCYVAAPDARGLGPHHDETEIFTLQISGTKRWRLFERIDSDQPGILEAEQTGPVVDDFVLEPGDMFYMPRGYVHDVSTTGEPSFSLTIVFSTFNWNAILDLLTARLKHTSAFMEPLPAGVLLDHGHNESLNKQFESRLNLMREELSRITMDTLVDDLAIRFVKGTTMPPYPQFEDLVSLDAVSLEALLERRSGVVSHVTRNGGKVTLTLPGGYRVEASDRAEPAIRQVLAADGSFKVSQMHPSLSDGARLALAKKLIACGLLCFAGKEKRGDLK